MTPRRPRRSLAALLPLLPLLSLSASAASQEPPPTFKRDVEVVTVDVVVTDKAGNPITGLLREDFTVLDEGAPQALVNFDVVTPPDGAGGDGDGDTRAPSLPASRRTPPPACRVARSWSSSTTSTCLP